MGSTAFQGWKSEPGPAGTEAELLLRHPRVHWQGWGCSLAWCGKALGGSEGAEAWADLLFTLHDVGVERLWPDPKFADQCPQGTIPGLGLNVVRYNVGGVGRVEEPDQLGERRSEKSRGWHSEIEGFLPTRGGEFDWDRDEAQRKFLQLAVDRGADEVELFANAPMWWMSSSKSSFGGSLESPGDFAAYLAEVTAHARSGWHLPVKSVAPFNEPSAGWWKFPHDQEGCNIPADQQGRLLLRLRDELDSRGLGDVVVAASDENRPDTAERTWKKLKTGPAHGCVGRINVHSYDGLEPWSEAKHPGVRASLRRLVARDGLPLWMSEFGSGSKGGLETARTILEDLHYMRPTAWCYWQLVEHRCSWGFVEAEFRPDGSRAITLPHPKFYVFAQFSRFLRPGMEMLQSTEPWVAAGFSFQDDGRGRLAAVLLNEAAEPRCLTVRAPGFRTNERISQTFVTEPDSAVYLREGQGDVASSELGGVEVCIEVPPRAICSVVVPGVWRAVEPDGSDGATVSVALVEELARLAASAACAERILHGELDVRTELLKARVEHATSRVAQGLEAVLPGDGSAERRRREVSELLQVVWTSAWGAANERVYGPAHVESKSAWEKFRAARKQCSLRDDLIWAVFNTSWAVVNEARLGKDSEDYRRAEARAREHVAALGGFSAPALPGCVFSSPDLVPSAPRWVALVGQAEGGTADQRLHEGPAGKAVLAADLLVTTPLVDAVLTANALHAAGGTARVVVDPAACDSRATLQAHGIPKPALLDRVPLCARQWEGWSALPDAWWPEAAGEASARADAFRESVRKRPEDRVVFVGQGSFWQLVAGRYVDAGEVVYCDRLLAR
ncbi:unnamed protein product [Prorocentrum cordatum]|uniref:Endo-beta-1,6-galactanase-like domain-containing protein n=1 Tax=Prorocentrum cordatum TaxID=2364126 RepID=A0ABN9Q8F3_9DINO|nr:unnamed protein product [Polarella glacialis]